MIFTEQVSRKPNHYPWADEFIEVMHNGFWTDKEFSFSSDVQDFHVRLNDQQREMVVRSLSAIGQIEIAVKTFWAKLGDNLPHPSLSDLGFVMANVEVIHNNAYERLIERLGLEEVFEQNLKLDWIDGRVKYLKKYTHRYYKNSKKQFIYALILFTLFVENVSLFSQFYIINWLGSGRFTDDGEEPYLKDTNQQVRYTRNEEDIHAKVGIKLIQTIRQEHPELFDEELEQKIAEESLEAFDAESNIVDWMVNGADEVGLSSDILKEFIKDRINKSLLSIGFSSIFEVDQDVLASTDWFNDELEGNTSSDFFAERPVEYSKSSQSITADDLF